MRFWKIGTALTKPLVENDMTLDLSVVGDTFPHLKDKMLVDLVNGLSVGNRLNQGLKQNQNQSFLKRNLDLLSGRTQRTQNNINDHLLSSLSACKIYLEEIAGHTTAHAYAICEINRKLDKTQDYVGVLANEILSFRQKVQDSFVHIDERLTKLEVKDRANDQLDTIFNAWQAGRFDKISPMAQCFLVLDRLQWGEFGYYFSQLDKNAQHDTLDKLKNRMIIAQKSLFDLSANQDLPKTVWLTCQNSCEHSNQALRFQGDYSWQNPNNLPMVFTATQYPFLDTEEQRQYNSLARNMIDIKRLSERMVDNVFVHKHINHK